MTMVVALLALACTAAAIIAVRREPRRTLNAPLCGAALVLVVLAAALTGGDGTLPFAIMLLVLASPLLALALVAALLVNGVLMLRREGRTMGNLLSGLAGLALVAAMVVSIGLVITGSGMAVALAVWIVSAVGWMGFLFASMLLYQSIYRASVPTTQRPDYVVALGSGLVRGQVGRLLGNRVRRASEVVKQWAAQGQAPVLVMSGGKGADEPRPEAEAMGEFARTELAIPDQTILEEAASTTTEENLHFTHALVAEDPRLGPDARGIVVTSNFHVLRAAELARREGLDVHVLGAPVAWYYWPSAVLREFVAQLVLHRWTFLVASLLVTLVPPALVLAGV